MQPLSFDYTIKRSNRKTLSIRITDEGAVLVCSPLLLPAKEIDRIVRNKAQWIENKLLAAKNKPSVIPFTKKELVTLKAMAQEKLPPLIVRYAKLIGVSYARITIRSQKSRWGSCSSRGNLSFNCLLMLAPPEVIDYVIVHELCHLKQMNHSFLFWEEVKRIVPNYRDAQKWLKENGESLIRRLPV